MSRHTLTREDIDLATLERGMSTRLGQTVTVSASPMPKNGMPGVLTVRVNDEEIDVADAVVQEVVAAHIRPPILDPLDELIVTLGTANTIALLRSALVSWAQTEKARRYPDITTNR